MPRIRDNLITDHSKAFWVRTREKLFGMTVDEFQKTKGGEQAWQAAQPGLQALSEFLTKHKRDSGPFILGSQVSYADLVLVAFIESTKRTSQAMLDRIVGFDKSIKELYEASSKWLERSSY
jgi:glutathione S-transferase